MWNILDKARTYKQEAKRCLMCLTEKYHIIFPKLNLLNYIWNMEPSIYLEREREREREREYGTSFTLTLSLVNLV